MISLPPILRAEVVVEVKVERTNESRTTDRTKKGRTNERTKESVTKTERANE